MSTVVSFEERALRDALGRFATGVTVVSTRGAGGQPMGMTVNSFAAVSLSPPLILWSIGRALPSYPAFESAERFAVNVLGAEDRDLSNHFAAPAQDEFADVDWRDGLHGIPVLRRPLASFECRTWQRYDGGDHLILVGLVERFSSVGEQPLLFFGGRYAVAADPAQADEHERASASFADLLI